MKHAFLAARALFFVVLMPGVVAGYVPLRLVNFSSPAAGPASAAAAVVILAGVAALAWCVFDFFAAGRGTLAPVDPPRQLVVRGLYRFTRNPMYNAVALILAGEALLFRSTVVLWYAAVVAALFHLFVVFYEEPALTSRFGDGYRDYRRAVPRWGMTTRPYRKQE